jgi:hypothetical protein
MATIQGHPHDLSWPTEFLNLREVAKQAAFGLRSNAPTESREGLVAVAFAWANVFANGGQYNTLTVKHVATGHYQVDYTTPFNDSPCVQVTPWSGGFVNLLVMANNTCDVYLSDIKGNPVDGAFMYLAVGNS